MRGKVAKAIRQAVAVTGKHELYRAAKRNHNNLNNPQKPKFNLSKRQQRLLEKRNRAEKAAKEALTKMKENIQL